MEVYISELDIETYRGIKNLKMENLAPINIITGDNNSGKTSVLELLQSVKIRAVSGYGGNCYGRTV